MQWNIPHIRIECGEYSTDYCYTLTLIISHLLIEHLDIVT